MIDEIIARLKSHVPALGGRAEGAMQLGALIASGAIPPRTPAAFVLPGGMLGREASAAAGSYVQGTDELVGIVLALRTSEASAQGGIDPLKALVDAVLTALCGWRPTSNAPGVLVLKQAALVSLNAGLVIFQIDLTIQNQLRIAR